MTIYTKYENVVEILAVIEDDDMITEAGTHVLIRFEDGGKALYPIHSLKADGGMNEVQGAIQLANIGVQSMMAQLIEARDGMPNFGKLPETKDTYKRLWERLASVVNKLEAQGKYIP